VFFSDVRVPADQLVGEENQGWSYAKFLLGNERTGIAQVGRTKVRLAEVKQHAADTGLLDDPLFAARLAEAENELAGTGTHPGCGSRPGPKGGKPNPASSVLKLRGSQLQQIATELLVEVAGPDALPFEAGDDIASPRWAQTSAPRYLNYRKTSIYGGSSEVQRNIIASTILGLDCEAAMDFQLSDEQALLRDTTRDLLSRSYDPESRNKVIGSDLGWSREVWSQLADTGILGLGFDPDESGQIEITVVLTESGDGWRPNRSCTPRWARRADRRTGQRRAEAAARRRRGRTAVAGVRTPRTRRTAPTSPKMSRQGRAAR
jgi:alkylation response protein AidB-like acyl-CoA dehydrogenase